jgi:hypothetical protein
MRNADWFMLFLGRARADHVEGWVGTFLRHAEAGLSEQQSATKRPARTAEQRVGRERRTLTAEIHTQPPLPGQ